MKDGENIIEKHVRPAFCTNDEGFEIRAVLAGEVIGQLAIPSAATYIRTGRLVPILLDNMVDHLHLYVFYGSRISQPARVRSFIDLVIERLVNNTEFVLSRDELVKLQRLK